jgi:hypothetical protein
MDRAPKDWMIGKYKEQGMLNTKYHLVNMPDPSVNQTLCVMPDTNVRSQSWEGHADISAAGEHCEALQGVELLHSVVKGQKSIAIDLWILQLMQPLQHLQAHMGMQHSWGQIHLDGVRSFHSTQIREGYWSGFKEIKEEH